MKINPIELEEADKTFTERQPRNKNVTRKTFIWKSVAKNVVGKEEKYQMGLRGNWLKTLINKNRRNAFEQYREGDADRKLLEQMKQSGAFKDAQTNITHET